MNDIDKIIKQEAVINAIEKAQNSYVVGSGIMPLIRAVPIIGDMISSSVDKALSDFQDKKQMELIDCILENSELITVDQVNDLEFIINFSKTVEAVKRLATSDKVKYFGNLIRNGYLRGERINNNDFEEYSNLLNELSYREITYLSFFKQYGHENELMQGRGWDQFSIKFRDEFKLNRSGVYVIFTRLKRTGFVDELYISDSGDVSDDRIDELEVNGNGFYLTTLFSKYYEIVLNMKI